VRQGAESLAENVQERLLRVQDALLQRLGMWLIGVLSFLAFFLAVLLFAIQDLQWRPSVVFAGIGLLFALLVFGMKYRIYRDAYTR
jgi:putative effector of murein hydrolase